MGSSREELERLWNDHRWDRIWLRDVERSGELHPHVVEVDEFAMARHLVTNEQYHQFMTATGREPPVDTSVHGPRKSAWRDGAPLAEAWCLPVASLSWEDARAYCEFVGGRLPTEAEWEWAARGPERLTFPWGDDWDREYARTAEAVAGEEILTHDRWRQWLRGGVSGGPYPVTSWLGSHVAQLHGPSNVGEELRDVSWCGVVGMAGHVREWCEDLWDPYFYERSDRRAPVCGSSSTRFPARVLRGGSWSAPAYSCRAAHRLNYPPARRDSNDHGVRPVFAVQP